MLILRYSMMKNLFTCCLLCLMALAMQAQQYGKLPVHEIGVGIGAANYLGDLSNTNDLFFFGGVETRAFRPALSVFYKSNFSNWFTFKSALNVSRIYGHDKWNANADRNLHFRSNVTDLALMMEWNWLPYKTGARNRKFTPYIGAGLAGYFNNPKAELNGSWVRLQPLGTEGQGLLEYPNRTKYSLVGFAIPMSLGMKWHFGNHFGMGIEMNYRYVFSDYLDDVSTVYPDLAFYENNLINAVAQEAIALSYREINGDPSTAANRNRGNSALNDAYFTVLVNLSYRIGQGSVVCPKLK